MKLLACSQFSKLWKDVKKVSILSESIVYYRRRGAAGKS